jgi:uncharacterized LabA/DUF88 family protein
MNRTAFLVDGFNVYHSILAVARDSCGRPHKWLDLKSLLSSYLSVIGGGATLEEIYYFTALAHHLDMRKPGVTVRHQRYIECLASTGVMPILGRFKPKTVYCHQCRRNNQHYEEKETDVAISSKLFELLIHGKADTIVLVTGDTDLAPAVRTAASLYPTTTICFAFPYRRKNKELAQLVSKHFLIKKDRYYAHQLPDPVVLPSGREIHKPRAW